MWHSDLIRLGGLLAMVGSVVFALVLLLRPWLNAMLAEAVTLPVFFLLLLVVVIVAIVAIVALLRGTHHGGLGIVACVVSLVGVVLAFVGILFLGFAGFYVIPLGVLVATVGLGILAILTTLTNALPWWSGVALVAGGLSVLLVHLPFPPLADSLMGVPWLVVGYAIFRAAGRRTERPPRVQ
jgi:hypothetical protein